MLIICPYTRFWHLKTMFVYKLHGGNCRVGYPMAVYHFSGFISLCSFPSYLLVVDLFHYCLIKFSYFSNHIHKESKIRHKTWFWSSYSVFMHKIQFLIMTLCDQRNGDIIKSNWVNIVIVTNQLLACVRQSFCQYVTLNMNSDWALEESNQNQ